jgi:predicted MFS family arabinose efflux permease
VLLQTGQALSAIGSESATVAYTLLVLELTHSPAKAGLTGFARLVPWVLFALPAGVVVDRWNRKHLMIVADVVRALALGALGLAAATGHLTFALVPILAFVEGGMYVFFNIAEIGAMRSVVPPAQLQRAFATEQARLSGVYLAGPPLGGFLFGVARSLPFLVDAISYAFSTASLLVMRTPFQETREDAEPAPLWTQVREGLSWLWERAFLRTCALLFVGTNFAFSALELTLIVVARRQGLSSAAIGALLAVIGALAFAGSLAAPRLMRAFSMRTVIIANMWLAVPVAVFLAAPNAFVLVASTAPLFFFNPSLNAMVIGYRVALVPDRLQGRVNSVARSLALLALPLGPVAAGLLLGAFSARVTVGCFAAFLIVLAVAATLSRSIRSAPSFEEATAATAAAS